MILHAILGVLIVVGILLEAFETVVLPRRVSRPFRFTKLLYRVTWVPWRAIARVYKKPRSRETFLSFYGPLSLLFVFAVWAVAIILGYAFLYYSGSVQDSTHPTFETCFYLSGTTMFTLGLGDVIPHDWAERFLVVSESGLGFGFLALILSYLPVIYQAFSRREVNIVLLDARAGSPPTAAEILRRHAGPNAESSLEQLLRDWERSSAEILESHISYPVVCYFRSQHNNESWLAAITAILDTTALLLSSVDKAPLARQAKLTFAMCRHTVVDLAQAFNQYPRGDAPDRLPPSELERLTEMLREAGFQICDDRTSREKFAKLRSMYEPYLAALSHFLYMDLPPWILAKEIADNWRTSAWGRISGLALATAPGPDDHSD